MYGQASLFTGVSPQVIACRACTRGLEMYLYQAYAQLGCFAFDDSIHVSSHPVAPFFGMISRTGTFASLSRPVVYGHAAPIVASPFLNRLTSSEARPQYFLTSGRCFFSSAIVASNCGFVSSYGSSIPSAGRVRIRWRAASAIWIGLFGTVILPLNLGL